MVLWLCGAFLAVALIGSITVAATRGWRLWKTFGAVSKSAGDAVAAVTATAATAEERVLSLGANTERLTRAIEHLQESLAELAVIRAAAKDVQDAVNSVRAFAPSK